MGTLRASSLREEGPLVSSLSPCVGGEGGALRTPFSASYEVLSLNAGAGTTAPLPLSVPETPGSPLPPTVGPCSARTCVPSLGRHGLLGQS